MNAVLFKQLPLIERKQARCRLALLDATLDYLSKKTFAEVTVEELCAVAEISRSSFFRYFNHKSDILHYYVRLWSIHATWHAVMEAKRAPGLKMIEEIVEWSAGQFCMHPRMFMEVMALRASDPEAMNRMSDSGEPMVTLAERLLRFPHHQGIENISEGTFFSIFRSNLEAAVSKGELPRQCDQKKIMLSLTSMIYGVPMMMSTNDHQRLATAYKEQMELLWAGIRATDHGEGS